MFNFVPQDSICNLDSTEVDCLFLMFPVPTFIQVLILFATYSGSFVVPSFSHISSMRTANFFWAFSC